MHLRRNSFLSRAGEHTQAALKGSAARGVGAIAGLAAGLFFLISVGLHSWASIGTRAVRLGASCDPLNAIQSRQRSAQRWKLAGTSLNAEYVVIRNADDVLRIVTPRPLAASATGEHAGSRSVLRWRTASRAGP
jgi:hypothetical protein